MNNSKHKQKIEAYIHVDESAYNGAGYIAICFNDLKYEALLASCIEHNIHKKVGIMHASDLSIPVAPKGDALIPPHITIFNKQDQNTLPEYDKQLVFMKAKELANIKQEIEIEILYDKAIITGETRTANNMILAKVSTPLYHTVRRKLGLSENSNIDNVPYQSHLTLAIVPQDKNGVHYVIEKNDNPFLNRAIKRVSPNSWKNKIVRSSILIGAVLFTGYLAYRQYKKNTKDTALLSDATPEPKPFTSH